jgi:hypothetical protein
MRLGAVAMVLLACGCAPAPVAPPVTTPPDPTADASYAKDAAELARMVGEASDLYRKGRADDAAAIITSAQPVQARLLSAPRPTLAAMEAASDLDHLYGTMLIGNRHFGWARLLFQKNQVRWKTWRPQTAETVRRRQQAETAIADCDRRIAE